MCFIGGCGGKGCAWCKPGADAPDGAEPASRGGTEPVENDNWLAWLMGR